MPPKTCLVVRRRVLNHHALNVRIQLILSRLMVLFEANDDCSKSMPFEARVAVRSRCLFEARVTVRSLCRSRRGWLFRAWLFEADACSRRVLCVPGRDLLLGESVSTFECTSDFMLAQSLLRACLKTVRNLVHE